MRLKPGKTGHTLFAVALLTCILLPLIQTIHPLVSNPPSNENRALAPPPSFEGKIRPKRIKREFDAYFADNFGLRPHLLWFLERINVTLFRYSRRVIFGNNDWLYLKGNPGAERDYRQRILFDLCVASTITEFELDRWASTLIRNRQALRKRGIAYYFVVVPNKHTIHRENLPGYLVCDNPATNLDRVLERVHREDPSLPIIDLRPALRHAKTTGNHLYYRTDTHWNPSGILVGYNALFDVLSRSHRLRYAAEPDRIERRRFRVPGGDLARLVGRGDKESESVLGLRLKKPLARQADSPLPRLRSDPAKDPRTWVVEGSDADRALIFHDSFFATSIRSLFSETFSETTYVWRNYTEIDMALVDRSAPDIVIHEFVERNLQGIFAQLRDE
ncbi:MAG: hypothetical protein DWQ08_06125 [Proteobacteria bacterium]|nr:MAG: hypothetical protein DWQ08_06125 [Pseudomonadota bacterium]